MDWDRVGLKRRVIAWLESVAEGARIKERRLDPLATSMRDFDDVSAHLGQIGAGRMPEHQDANQRVTDLRSAGLVDSGVEGVHLTELGAQTLEAWDRFGVANAAKGDELARVVLLLITAQSLRIPQYGEYFKYWDELRASFPTSKLIDNWDTLYLLNYLDHEIDGFAPGTAFRDIEIPFEDIEFDLDILARNVGSGPAIEAADRIQRAINAKIPRGRTRALFAIGFELLAERALTPRLLLELFGLPKRPRLWEELTSGQIEKIEEILLSHGFAMTRGRGLAVAPAAEGAEDRRPYSLPEELDFSDVLQPTPSVVRRRRRASGRSARKVDFIRKTEANALVGNLGEEFAFRFERWRLRDQPHLQARVARVSLSDDSLGYDIQSWEPDGRSRLVEVKSTLGPIETGFFITANELSVAEEASAEYLILRVGNLKAQPKCCEIHFPFDEIDLQPAVYSATFKEDPEGEGRS